MVLVYRDATGTTTSETYADAISAGTISVGYSPNFGEPLSCGQ